MRAALVDYFRDEAAIMIATEAAVEGLNLQFCNLVVNYDLPWNPQRIEQRIGRCHRYGQKFDVVVVNFLNNNNAADQRVYELLAEKFRLFSGVYIQRRRPGASGFSASNLWRMRQFFESYSGQPKLAPLVRELSWTHNLLIMSRCKRDEEREFYLRLCQREKWGKRELERQLAGAFFERTVLSPPKLAPAVRKLHPDAASVFKDTYLIEFLDLPKGHSEADLHRGLVEKLKQFLIELGRDFCFVGSEYRLQVGGRDFFLDLLFFNRALNALVDIELKVEEFQPEHLGKLEFCLEALDRDVRKPHERPSIGVLLEPPKIRVSAGQLDVRRGGVVTQAMSVGEEQVAFNQRPIPDVLAYLQNETELTRSTLVRILKGSGRLAEFFHDPQRFMDAVAHILKYELHRLLVDGIKYEKISGGGPDAEWEMMLFKNEELINYLTALQVNHSVYEYVVYESEVEREFAKRLDEREDIKLFVKLPAKFEIDTPVGKYNPDWAVVKQDGQAVYLVRETKGTKDFLKLRTAEADKVRCGQKHFEALGVPFAVVVSADEV